MAETGLPWPACTAARSVERSREEFPGNGLILAACMHHLVCPLSVAVASS